VRVQARRRHLIKILKEVSADLQREEALNVAKAGRAKAAGRTRRGMAKDATAKRPANGKRRAA
jgi:hypothetical protein